MIADAENQIAAFHERFESAKEQIGRVIVGNEEIVETLLTAMLCDGHVLLEGIPGLGKTKLVQTLGQVLDLDFARIQFTPDLMPGDIIGTNIVDEDEAGHRALRFQKGPVFAHLILADEINRATPKTQSALLEAMQEKTVSVGQTTHVLAPPFFVLATQNPLEMEGTYPLPEAQLDRFLFKLKMTYPSADELQEIMDRTTQLEQPQVETVLDGPSILEMRSTVRSVPISRDVQSYAIRLALATQPSSELAHESTKRYVRFGSSPRGIQALVIGAKVRALLADRAHVACEDVRSLVKPAMRHRVLLNFEGEAERIDPDDILEEILSSVSEA
ncbi:MAG: MoxR family ATPase [Acidobacteriota bacterium]